MGVEELFTVKNHGITLVSLRVDVQSRLCWGKQYIAIVQLLAIIVVVH